MRSFRTCCVALAILTAATLRGFGQSHDFEPWATCAAAEGKAYGCGPAQAARPFDEFRKPGAWSKAEDEFLGEFAWGIEKLRGVPPAVTWHEAGKLGTHAFRVVSYQDGDGAPFAYILLAERDGGTWSPLLKWAGEMPEPKIYTLDSTPVLVIAKDFGGFGPEVPTWAWVWGKKGPVRLDVDKAVQAAIDKVAPGYSGYRPGIDWDHWRNQNWVWKGAYPGKTGVGETVLAWFDLDANGLSVTRAVYRQEFKKEPKIVRWSLAHDGVLDLPAAPSAGASVSPAPCDAKAGTEWTPVRLLDCFVRTSQPLPRYMPAAYRRHRREAILAIAKQAGMDPVAMNDKIVEWARSSTDPLERGLSALYVARADAAVDLLLEAVRKAAPDGRLADAYFYLGRALFGRERFAEADQAYRRADALRPNDRAILRSWGVAKWELWEYAGAEAMLRKALALDEKASGERSAEVAQDLDALGEVLYARYAYDEIETLTRRRLEIAKSVWGAKSAAAAEALNDLAIVTVAKGDNRAAEALYAETLAIQEKVLGPDDAETAETVSNRGSVAAQLKSCADAMPALQHALAIREKALGGRHPDVADSLNVLGLCSESLGNQADAEKYYQRALDLLDDISGDDDASTAAYAGNLANLRMAQASNVQETEALFRRSIQILERVYQAPHPDMVDPMVNLAVFYSRLMGKQDDAVVWMRRALEVQEKVSPPDSVEVAGVLNNLEALLINQGKNDDAEPLVRRALAIQETKLGAEHPDVARSLSDLGVLLMRKGEAQQAVAVLRRSLAIREKVFGADHEDTKAVRERLDEATAKLQGK